MIQNLLSGTQANVVQAIQRTQRSISGAQLSLASGKSVLSAIDNPINFFTSQSLSSKAADLNKLLDGTSKSIRTIEEANNGVEAMLDLIDQAEALVNEALVELFPRTDEEVDQRAIDYIRELNPDKGYFPELGNFYTQTTEFVTWQVARANAEAAGLDGVPEITGHLATITSQEENDVIAGLLTSSSWLGGSDDEVENTWRWVVGPEAGQQFWQGLAGGTAVNGAYENWAPGEPNQFFGPGNPENFAHMRADGLWNDLPNNQNLNYIIEWGGDLFVQNPDVNVSSQAMDYRDDYLNMMTQIQEISNEASFRGVQLLNGDDLVTDFNIDRDNTLETEGLDASTAGLGLIGDNFVSKTEATKLLTELQDARKVLRSYSASLATDLSIVTTRREYIQESANTHLAGSDDLTVADQNQVGAEILALQTRQQLQVEVLSLSSNVGIADLLFRR